MQPKSDAEPHTGKLGNPLLVSFLLLAVGTLSIAFSVIAPLLGPIAAELGGEAVAQQIVVAPLAGFAVGGILAGFIVSALGARNAILAAAALYTVTGASGLYASNANILIANIFILGICAVVLMTAAGVVLAHHFHDGARARVLGLQTAAGSLLNGAAVLLSGIIGESVGWRFSFLLFVALGLIVLVIAVMSVRAVPKPAKGAGGGGPAAYLPLAPIFLAAAAYLVVTTNTATHTSLLLRSEHVDSPTIAAVIISLQGWAAMVGGFLYGPIATRVGRLTALGVGLAFCAVGFVLPGVLPSVVMFGVATSALGISVGLIMPFLTERLLGAAPEKIRAQALGFFATGQFAGAALNPLFIGPVREALGLHGMYIACGVATAVVGFGAVAFLAGRPAPQVPASLH